MGWDVGNTAFSRCSTVCIAAAPLFLQYIFILDYILLPEIFLAVLLLVSVFKKPIINVSIFRWLLVYLFFVFVSVGVLIGTTENLNSILALTTYARFFFYSMLLVFVSVNFFNIGLGAKLVIFIAVLNSAYGLLQFIFYKLLGVILPWYLPFLTVHYGTELIAEQAYYFNTFGYRFSGLFSEPAHLSQYISFALLLLLFYRSSTFKPSMFVVSFCAFIILCALLLSGSGTGFIEFMFIALFWFLNNFSSSKRKGVFYFNILLFFAAIYFFAGIESDSFFQGLARISSDSEYSTLYIRVIRPFEVYFSLDTIQQLFGVGYGNYAEYLKYNYALNEYEELRGVAWTNAAVFIMAGVGLVGFILYMTFHVSVYFKSEKLGKGIVVFVVMHLVYSDLSISVFYVTMMSFVFASMSKYKSQL